MLETFPQCNLVRNSKYNVIMCCGIHCLCVGDERDDSDDEGGMSDNSDEDDDDAPYNPKNLPLGWDGKPIPYWLYKLHGLNLYYSCEICGNQTYRGPKAFQLHFAVSS